MESHVHQLVVPRTARYYTMGALDGPVESVWFLLHGYGQLGSDFVQLAKALAGEHRLLVAPEALSRFYHEDHRTIGASWMTREDRDHEMADYIRYLDLLHDQIFQVVPRSEVCLNVLGFSQGTATAARWAVRGQADVDHLVLWGQALPPELDDDASLAPLRAMRLSLVSGTRDRLFPDDQRAEQRERLERHAVPFNEWTFEGGHRLDDDTLQSLEGSC